MEHVPASRVARMVAKILVENDDLDFVVVTTRPKSYGVSFQTETLDGLLVLRRRLIENDGYDLPFTTYERGSLSQLHASSGYLGNDARLAVHIVTITSAEKLREIGVLQ